MPVLLPSSPRRPIAHGFRVPALLALALCASPVIAQDVKPADPKPAEAPAAKKADAAEASKVPLEEIRRYVSVFNAVKYGYVEPVDDRKLMQSAIRGLLQDLDPHSAYLVRSDAQAFDEDANGAYDGIGVEVQQQPDGSIATHEGNCHNLAYLYKILADEVGAKCWLALAPGHIYIKNYSEKIGWYNTELTSGTFPTDAWVMVSGYVNPQAMKSGMYMDTLSNRQAIALCVLDLAKGYEFQTHNYYDGFILKCCDLVLQYHPVNPIALLLKAETLKKVFIKEQKDKYPKPTTTFTLMQEAYAALAKLGYREMPEEMYKRWLIEMTEEKNIYQNKQLQEK